MKLKIITLLLLLIIGLSIAACVSDNGPEGSLTAAKLLENPAYDTEVTIYGKVSDLGELLCTCFILSSGGQSIHVWYDTMVENDGTVRPKVDVMEYSNGDELVVIGELKADDGIHYTKNDFWAHEIFLQ